MFGFVKKEKYEEHMRAMASRIYDLEESLKDVINMNNSEIVELKSIFTWCSFKPKDAIVFEYFEGIKRKEIVLMSGIDLDIKDYSIEGDIIKIVREDGYVHAFEVDRRKGTSTDLTKILESIEKRNKVTT